jgi:hypothetical protein
MTMTRVRAPMADFLESHVTHDPRRCAPNVADYHVSYTATRWLGDARTMSETVRIDFYFKESALEFHTYAEVCRAWPDAEISDYRLSYLDRPWHTAPSFTEDENGNEVTGDE